MQWIPAFHWIAPTEGAFRSAPEKFPVLQKAVFDNPLAYPSKSWRTTPLPPFPHLSLRAVLGALVILNFLLFTMGLKKFYRKAVS